MTTVGRLIVGLAGPRAINRRYITDLPKSMLSSGSAGRYHHVIDSPFLGFPLTCWLCSVDLTKQCHDMT